MGSLAVDQDGNLAIGYSVSSTQTYPSIRIAGRLASETPGQLPQAEVELVAGLGAQTGTHRWGDYSALTVAPDGCTFYYTTEYLLETGSNWQTWITPFRYPSCGQPKGFLQGTVRNAETSQPLAGVPVVVASTGQTISVETDASGFYTINLATDVYAITAGPLLPGYPVPAQLSEVMVSENTSTTQDLTLTPYPALTLESVILDDPAPGGNLNLVPEPGERRLRLRLGMFNEGAATAQSGIGRLTSVTPGVTPLISVVVYPDITPDQSAQSINAYRFSLDPLLPCGARLDFMQELTDSLQTYTHTLSLDAAVLQPRQTLQVNAVEQGQLLWRTEGVFNTWKIVTLADAPSPSHVWTDTQFGGYRNNTDASLVTPAYNFSGLRRVQVSLAARYALEPGWDYLFIEYSLDGGQTWEPDPLAALTGFQPEWSTLAVDASPLDGQPNAALRFRLVTDVSIIYDGVYLDDIALTYEPYTCVFPVLLPPVAPIPLSPMADELFHPNLPAAVNFSWLPGASGAPLDGYRLFLDGVQVADLPPGQTQYLLQILPGVHTWWVQAYNGTGDSPLSKPTQFWLPFNYYYPIIGR
jgi:hypothetical protein